MKGTPYKILEEIKQKKYHPVYFLYGEEPYFIDQVTEAMIQNVLTEEEKAFNQHIFYGKDTTASTIADTARRFPMMSEHQLVVVKEAQQLQELDSLSAYLETPQPSTILVICYKHKKPDRRKKIFQLFEEKSMAMESPKIRENRIPEWIMRYCKEKGVATDVKSSTLLAESLGNDLEKIVNEIEKLLLVLPRENQRITPDLIEKYIGFSKEYNHYELNNALSDRDVVKANRIIQYFCHNQNAFPIQVTLGYLYFYFSKLLIYHAVKKKSNDEIARHLKVHPFFVTEYRKASGFYSVHKIEEVISVLRDIDLKSKGFGSISATPCDLLIELIYKIMH
ncbi:MAG: DNA polymerase III subunit delta [Chlorobi bacterium]|nr:DNA polymerase III subunit delta [Chlorobiota bacterium]